MTPGVAASSLMPERVGRSGCRTGRRPRLFDLYLQVCTAGSWRPDGPARHRDERPDVGARLRGDQPARGPRALWRRPRRHVLPLQRQARARPRGTRAQLRRPAAWLARTARRRRQPLARLRAYLSRDRDALRGYKVGRLTQDPEVASDPELLAPWPMPSLKFAARSRGCCRRRSTPANSPPRSAPSGSRL